MIIECMTNVLHNEIAENVVHATIRRESVIEIKNSNLIIVSLELVKVELVKHNQMNWDKFFGRNKFQS